MAKGGQCFEKVRRGIWTVFFMVAMLASLLVTSLPVLVAAFDVLVPCVLISSFTCVRCYGFKEHLHRYSFKSSLTDIPLVSIIRSLIIICVYSICDGPALSHGPYLGTVSLSSFLSVVLLSVKACVFSVNSHIEAEAAASLSKKRLHLKKSWGMPVLFLSSVVFALGHTVVAYRTSCRARRKLLFHRVDPEAVLSCKVFPCYQKVPRSPTPSGVRTPKSDSEMRRRPFGLVCDEERTLKLLAESDSLFITCQGLTVHYKVSLPGSPLHTLSSASIVEPNLSSVTSSMAGGFSKYNRHLASMSPNIQRQLHRSYSNQFHGSSLYTPLLDGPVTSPALSEDIPALCLEKVHEETNKLDSMNLEKKLDGTTCELGVVLVHGFGGGVFSWRHVMGSIARQSNCTVAAFDRPGWGLTSRPRRKEWEEKDLPNPYKLDSQVDLLLSFCSEIGFSSVVLIGHDDGGLLALKAAQRVQSSMNCSNIASYLDVKLPQLPVQAGLIAYVITHLFDMFISNMKFNNIICFNCRPLVYDNVTIKGVILLNVNLSREVVPSFARILLHTSLGKKHLVRPLLRTEITQVVNRRAWYDSTKLTTEVLSLYKAPLYVEGWDEALHEIGKLSSETVHSAKNAELLLQALGDVPVLIIAGAEDSLVSLSSCQTMGSKLVNSRLVAISGCGHLPHEECPKALLAAISPFISRLSVQDSQN